MKGEFANTMSDIREALQGYLDLAYFGGAKLPECIREDARMFTSDGKEISELPLTLLLRGDCPANRGEVRDDAVLSVDISYPDMACAKVRMSIGEHRFTDYLSLLLVEGKWKIVAKLYADVRENPGDIFPDIDEQYKQTEGIKAALGAYFDALYKGRAELHDPVFADGAEIMFAGEDGKLFAAPAVPFLRKGLSMGPSPESRGESRHDFIHFIEFSGRYTALVKLNCANPPAYYTDYLLMAAVNGEWKIVSKATRMDLI